MLPDAHWVGGNPWDGSKANVYGWAAWNGEKATLALRNPSADKLHTGLMWMQKHYEIMNTMKIRTFCVFTHFFRKPGTLGLFYHHFIWLLSPLFNF